MLFVYYILLMTGALITTPSSSNASDFPKFGCKGTDKKWNTPMSGCLFL